MKKFLVSFILIIVLAFTFAMAACSPNNNGGNGGNDGGSVVGPGGSDAPDIPGDGDQGGDTTPDQGGDGDQGGDTTPDQGGEDTDPVPTEPTIMFQSENITLALGKTRSILLKLYNIDTSAVTVTSSNPSIVSVNGATMTGVAEGSATLTATLDSDQSITATTTVTVAVPSYTSNLSDIEADIATNGSFDVNMDTVQTDNYDLPWIIVNNKADKVDAGKTHLRVTVKFEEFSSESAAMVNSDYAPYTNSWGYKYSDTWVFWDNEYVSGSFGTATSLTSGAANKTTGLSIYDAAGTRLINWTVYNYSYETTYGYINALKKNVEYTIEYDLADCEGDITLNFGARATITKVEWADAPLMEDDYVKTYDNKISLIQQKLVTESSFIANSATVGGKWISVDEMADKRLTYDRIAITVTIDILDVITTVADLGISFGSGYQTALAWKYSDSAICFADATRGDEQDENSTQMALGRLDAGGLWSNESGDGNGLVIKQNGSIFADFNSNISGGWKVINNRLVQGETYVLEFYTNYSESLDIYLGAETTIHKIEWLTVGQDSANTISKLSTIETEIAENGSFNANVSTVLNENGLPWIRVDQKAAYEAAGAEKLRIRVAINEFGGKSANIICYGNENLKNYNHSWGYKYGDTWVFSDLEDANPFIGALTTVAGFPVGATRIAILESNGTIPVLEYEAEGGATKWGTYIKKMELGEEYFIDFYLANCVGDDMEINFGLNADIKEVKWLKADGTACDKIEPEGGEEGGGSTEKPVTPTYKGYKLTDIQTAIDSNGSFVANETNLGGKWISVDEWSSKSSSYTKLCLTVTFDSFENLGLNNFGSYPEQYPVAIGWSTSPDSVMAFIANDYGRTGVVGGTLGANGLWYPLASQGNGLLVNKNNELYLKYFSGSSDGGAWHVFDNPLETGVEYVVEFYTYLGGSVLELYLGGNAVITNIEWATGSVPDSSSSSGGSASGGGTVTPEPEPDPEPTPDGTNTLTDIKAITDQGTTFTTSEENMGGQWITVDNWADIKANYTCFKITLEFNSFVNKDFSDLGYTYNGANYPAFVAYRPEGQSDWLAFVSSTYNTDRVVCGCLYQGIWTSPYGSGSNGLVITRGGSDYIDFRYTDNTDLSAWEDYFIGSGANAIDKGFETGVQYEFSFYSEMGANSLVLYLGTDTVIKSIEYVK